MQRRLPEAGAGGHERRVPVGLRQAGLQHDLLAGREHVDAVRHRFEIVEQRRRRVRPRGDFVGVHRPGVIGEPRRAADHRSGHAERDGAEARRRAEVADERRKQIGERRERGGGISEEVDLRGPGRAALEHAEERLGAAHVARQNHLGWIIVKPA